MNVKTVSYRRQEVQPVPTCGLAKPTAKTSQFDETIPFDDVRFPYLGVLLEEEKPVPLWGRRWLSTKGSNGRRWCVT